MSRTISTDNPFLQELITGLNTIAGIEVDKPTDPRNQETGHNTERDSYALEAIGHGLAAVAYEISQLRADQEGDDA